ncbi:hypothetical protein L345_08280, partial [Ophiophagus hannah]
ITRIYCYVTVVSLQYLAPIFLTLHCTLLLKTLGKGFSSHGSVYSSFAVWRTSEYSWGLYPEPALTSPAPDAIPVRQAASSEDSGKEDIQAAVEQITASLSALGTVFTPLFYRGLFSFYVWWIAACQVVSIFFGLYFHQHLAVS